jgi:hypothetical protein
LRWDWTTADGIGRLDRPRQIAAVLTFVLLILTFMPEPMALIEPTFAPMFEGERTPVLGPLYDSAVLDPI